MNNQIQLIAKLKTQPRQGSIPNAIDLLNTQAKELYKTFKDGGADVVRASGFALVGEAAMGAYEKVNVLEKQNRKLSESFGVSTMRAAQLSQGFDKLGISLGVNTDKLKIYAGELKKMFPGQAAYLANARGFGKEIMKQAELMQNKLGLSAEVTEGFIRNQALLSQKSTDNFDSLNEEIAKYSATLRGTYEGAFTDITEGIGNLDAETAAVFGRQGIGNLSQAVLGAKKLGIELSKVLSTGTGFLDVEQAIGNEIELQMLGAKDLNISAIQQARLSGDGLALTKELTKYLEANGEEMKRNPYLLQKSAEALGFTNDELLKMYANLQQNGKLEEAAANTKLEQIKIENEARRAAGKQAMTTKEEELFLQKEIDAVLEKENARRRAAGEAEFKSEVEREQFLADKRSEADKAEDKYQQEYANTIGDQVEQVMKLAGEMDKSMAAAAGLATKVVTALNDSDLLKELMGAGGFLSTVSGFIGSLKTGNTAVPGMATDAVAKSDVFIPAGGASSIISGPKGSFSLDPDDDIIAMPNARNALANRGGGDTAAVIAALKGMAFHVTNVFDGDKIRSSLQIRQGQQLNNTGIV
jgi:hypothetical protein